MISDKYKEKNYLSAKIIHISFLMSILVIFIHANNLSYYDLGSDQSGSSFYLVNFIGDALGKIAVPMFFMISGYLFFCNINVDDNRLMQIIFKKLKKRIKSVLIPYLLWNIFGTIFYMAIPRIPFVASVMNGSAVELSIGNLFRGFFLHAYYFPLWYLGDLIIVLAFTPVWGVLLRRKFLIGMVLCILAAWQLSGLPFPVISAGSIFFFLCGAFCARYADEIFKKRKSLVTAVSCLIVFLLMCIVRTVSTLGIINEAFYLFSPMMLWRAFDILPCGRTPLRFEKQSFFIYCSHVIPVTAIGKLFLTIGGHEASQLWIILSYISAPFITLIILYAAYRILSKCTPKFYNLICGGRG